MTPSHMFYETLWQTTVGAVLNETATVLKLLIVSTVSVPFPDVTI